MSLSNLYLLVILPLACLFTADHFVCVKLGDHDLPCIFVCGIPDLRLDILCTNLVANVTFFKIWGQRKDLSQLLC